MPIYEYRCSSCGCQKEFLRKVSDPVLSTCPECGKETFSKMLTAAGFQLKGSGWYATDFRNNGAAPAAKPDEKPESGKDKSSDSADKTDKSEKLPTSAKSDASSTSTGGTTSGSGSTASESAAP